MSTIHPRRPLTVLCEDWEPAAEGSKACRYYVEPEHGCQLPKNLVCVEWARKFGATFVPTAVPNSLRQEQARNVQGLSQAIQAPLAHPGAKEGCSWALPELPRIPYGPRAGNIDNCSAFEDERTCQMCGGGPCPDGPAAQFMSHAPPCELCGKPSTRVCWIDPKLGWGKHLNLCATCQPQSKGPMTPKGKLVVHHKREPFDVYIGRPGPWGNPFSHENDSLARWLVPTRAEAIEKYDAWVMAQPELVAKIKTELKGKVLGCWCDPKPCHGHVLARIANGFVAYEIEGRQIVDVEAKVTVPSALDLLATPAEARAKVEPKIENGFLSAPEPKKMKAKDVARATAEALAPVPKELRDEVAHNEQFRPAKWIEPEALASLEKLGAEITLAGEPFGEVVLVTKYTDQDRKELTFQDAATLRLIVDCFPGAHVGAFTKKANIKTAVGPIGDFAEPDPIGAGTGPEVCAACGCKNAWSVFDKPCAKCGASKGVKPASTTEGWDS